MKTLRVRTGSKSVSVEHLGGINLCGEKLRKEVDCLVDVDAINLLL